MCGFRLCGVGCGSGSTSGIGVSLILFFVSQGAFGVLIVTGCVCGGYVVKFPMSACVTSCGGLCGRIAQPT